MAIPSCRNPAIPAPVGNELGCPAGVFFIEVRPHHSASLSAALAYGGRAYQFQACNPCIQVLTRAAPLYLADELCQSADLSMQHHLRSALSSLVVCHTRLSIIML